MQRSLTLLSLLCLAAPAALAQERQPPPDSTAAADSAAPRPRPLPDSATLASAYLDADARELVRLARERRRTVDRSIEAYETTVHERVSIGLRVVRRDRTVWEREVASRIEWERDGPIRIEALGAREVVPIASADVQVPGDLEGYLPRLAFDPADPYLLTGWDDTGDEIPHPLAPGSEVDYRFRTGDTTVIRLPDGREVRLLELEVLPRRKAGNLVQGSLWLDEDTHAVVQLTFRLADEFRLDREGEAPRIVEPRLKLEYLTIEYGLWDFQWWLPRVMAIRGAARIGRLFSVPFVYERTYTDYEVRGEPASAPPVAVEETEYAAGRRVRCPSRVAVYVSVRESGNRTTPADSAELARQKAARDSARAAEYAKLTPEQRRECDRLEVVVPEDRVALLESSMLSPAPLAAGEALLTEAELESIVARLEQLPGAPWQLARPRFSGPFGGGLARYNRVEGLSLGAGLDVDLGRIQAGADARIGTADLEPNGEVRIARDGMRTHLQLAGYRRLVSMDPEARPFTLAASLSSLLLGHDEADYYRTLGVELTGAPAISRRRWYDWRVYAQRETAAQKETDFSVAHLIDKDHVFPENDSAQEATQYGAALRLRGGLGRNPAGLRAHAELGLDGAAGTFRYWRPALTLRTYMPLPGPFVGMLEGAAGTSFGDLATQHLWRVGGPTTLRGYPSGAMAGESFWRGRVEVATSLPLARLVLFSDAGWAGSRENLRTDPWLLSAGAGVSLLDGFVRVDLARALKTPTGWRLMAYLDAWQ